MPPIQKYMAEYATYFSLYMAEYATKGPLYLYLIKTV